MTEEAKEARRAYKRDWYRRNPDKVKAQQERHWQRIADAMKQTTIPAQAPEPDRE